MSHAAPAAIGRPSSMTRRIQPSHMTSALRLRLHAWKTEPVTHSSGTDRRRSDQLRPHAPRSLWARMAPTRLPAQFDTGGNCSACSRKSSTPCR